MARPVVAVVAAGPDVQAQSVGAGKCRVRGAERIGGADVEPDAAAERERRVDDVVACEVLRVVEGSRGRLTARAPERRRVAADGAEPARVESGRPTQAMVQLLTGLLPFSVLVQPRMSGWWMPPALQP